MPEKVLVVDDEHDIADLLEVYLQNENYIVYKFYSAREALDCIENQEVDLAILDIMLPDVNGFSICQKIREKYTYPIIMLTAKDEETDKITGLTLGADDYITKGNTTEISMEDDLTVIGDPEKLARVFNNLLRNAASYCYANTEISISAKKKGNYAVVIFQNCGPTIPADQLNTIFDKFNRLDEARTTNTGGAGLGLSIAKEIVNLHGGEITAQSQNELITFTVTLPLTD